METTMAEAQGHEHDEHHDHEHHHEEQGHHHHEEHDHEHHEIIIHIDHKKYPVCEHRMTGSQIRAVAKPPISVDYDLFMETRGPGDDRKIGDTEEVHMRDGESFYSVLRQINPGARDAVA